MTGYAGGYFILGACPVVVALAMLRGVRALAPFSLIADAANVLGEAVYTECLCSLLLCSHNWAILLDVIALVASQGVCICDTTAVVRCAVTRNACRCHAHYCTVACSALRSG